MADYYVFTKSIVIIELRLIKQVNRRFIDLSFSTHICHFLCTCYKTQFTFHY